MTVKFYYNQSDSRVINKVILLDKVLEGVPVGSIDMMNPSIRFSSKSPIFSNYAYIEEFHRYYTVASKTLERKDVYVFEFEEDVLMSFRGDIWKSLAVVDKQSERSIGDEYIDDGSLVTENMRVPSVLNFANGFNQSPEYILITAG